ncbi:peptidyl-tRNA hydrolase [Colletotrichum asianum]
MAAPKQAAARILLISLGNPRPYTDTLHSAGHRILKHLQTYLPAQPAFSRTTDFNAGKGCQASIGERYSLLQSPTQMNVSGGFVKRAFERELRRMGGRVDLLHLVVVHDDLELGLGDVRLRKWLSSHRGHNGVKSINKNLKKSDYEGARWARISVGIGRPEGRDREEVSSYVLRPMTDTETRALDEVAAPEVLLALADFEKKLEEYAKLPKSQAAE